MIYQKENMILGKDFMHFNEKQRILFDYIESQPYLELDHRTQTAISPIGSLKIKMDSLNWTPWNRDGPLKFSILDF